MNLSLEERFPKPQAGIDAYFKNVMDKIRGLPGIEAAGAVSNLPLAHSESLSIAWVDGFPNVPDQVIEARMVSPQYLEAMHIPLIKGRTFNESDASAAVRPVIINQQFARTYFAGRDPMGGRISFDQHHEHWSTVIGVAADVRHTSMEETPQPQSYSSGYDFSTASIAILTALPAAKVVPTVRATLQAIDPKLVVTDIHTMGDLVSEATARRRFQTSLLTAFAGIALLLAREVGIRMALGAQRRDVLFMVLKNAARMVGAGLAAGLICAWMATRALGSFLFGVNVHDPVTTIAVSVLMIVCGLLAALVPARRAASADPMQALRME
jgi:putative ABC transport system permease protein